MPFRRPLMSFWRSTPWLLVCREGPSTPSGQAYRMSVEKLFMWMTKESCDLRRGKKYCVRMGENVMCVLDEVER